MHPPASRALRREILRIAALDPADVDELVALLAPAHRDRVQQLLREALMLPGESARVSLAAWIEDRIEGRVAGMNERARPALAQCAGHAVQPRPAPPPQAARSLLEQTISVLRRSGR